MNAPLVLPKQSPATRLSAWFDTHARQLLIVLITGYILVISYASIRKFQLYEMGFDLGLIQQAVWNTIHGRFFESYAYDFTNNLLGTDSFFVLLIFMPFYALLPNPATMLVIQTLVVASAAIPVYLLAQQIVGHRWAGPLAALLYLAYLPVINGNLYEIRERIMAGAFVLWMMLCIYRGWYRRMWLPLVLALSCRLDATIGVAMVGVYALLLGRPLRFGLTLIGSAVVWYLFVTRVMIPHYLLAPIGYIFLEHYGDFGTTPLSIVTGVLSNPLHTLLYSFTAPKLWYLLGMFLPLAFLTLGDWRSLLSVIPLYGLNLLANRAIQWDIYHHYQGMIVPFMLVGALTTLATLERRGWLGNASVERLAALMVVCTLLAPVIFGTQLPGLLFPRPKPRLQAANQIVQEVPPGAPLAVGNLLTPHVAPREGLYLVPGDVFHYVADPFGKAQYAVLDLHQADERAAWLAAQTNWCVQDQQIDYVLAQRRAGAHGAHCTP